MSHLGERVYIVTGNRHDQYPTFKIILEIDNVGSAMFSECSRLMTEIKTIAYSEGDEHYFAQKLPGLKNFADITLKRGITQGRLSKWEGQS